MANEREGMPREEAGRMSGENQNKENKPGNFANDPQKASEAGRKGGEQSGGSRGGEQSRSGESGSQGGGGQGGSQGGSNR